MEFEPVGFVKSRVTEAVDEGWGEVVSEIHLAERLAHGLRGIDQFSHLLASFFSSSVRLAVDSMASAETNSDIIISGILGSTTRSRTT